MATPFIWRNCFLVALPRPEDLLLCAKHLFVAARKAFASFTANARSREQGGRARSGRAVELRGMEGSETFGALNGLELLGSWFQQTNLWRR